MKQREIKFRAWNSQTKKMIDLKAITPFALNEGMTGDGLYLPFFEEWPLMQFTGLNANSDPAIPIYEGDIYKSTVYSGHPGKWDRFIGQVVFQEPAFKLKGIGKYEGRTAELHALGTILGNIYENPELLTPSGHD